MIASTNKVQAHLSLVVPFYNEQVNIDRFFDAVMPVLH